MRLYLAAIIFLAALVIFLAHIADVIDPGQHLAQDHRQRSDTDNQDQKNAGPYPNDKFDNLFWFVQVTDIHISIFHDQNRAPDLKKFCKEQLSVIRPHLVLLTGDLVDAKLSNLISSRQFEEEWRRYRNVVEECGLLDKRKLLDIRGNHDAFDVPYVNGPKNFFRKYSVQGTQSSYKYKYETDFGTYTFVGIDASPEPGLKRPFNFFGYMWEKQIAVVKSLLNFDHASNHTIAFGHYPTSMIVSSPSTVKSILSDVTMYLCGHLHTLGNFVRQMHTRHKSGTLELELGDWKDNRMFRLVVIDHDLISFVDEVRGRWPVVVITNPKHAVYLSPAKEPTYRIEKSTHIRMMIFTNGSDNIEAPVYIDDVYMGQAIHVEGPLYVLPWQPSQYLTGLHNIRVKVTDVNGNQRDVTQPFTLDGSQPGFSFSSRFVLMMDFVAVGKFLFLFFFITYITVLVFLKQCLDIRRLFFREKGILWLPCRFLNQWLYRLWLIPRVPVLFYLLVGSIIYVAIGPWIIGELMEHEMGVIFVWGIYVQNTFLPGSLTYFYGLIQVITFHIPVLFYLGYALDKAQGGLTRRRRFQISDIPFLLILTWQTYVTLREFPATYGKQSLLSPVRLGSVFMLLWMRYIIYRSHVKLKSDQNGIGNAS